MIVVREEYCPQNHPCPTVRVCPTGAITQRGFAAPEVDEEKCTNCCRCVRSCAAFTGVGCCTGRERRSTV